MSAARPGSAGNRVPHTLSLLAALVCAGGALTGCGSVPAPAPLTIAVTGSMAEPAPWSPALEDLATRHALRAAVPGDGTVSVVVSTNPAVAAVDLTPLRAGREVEQDQTLARERVRALIPGLRTALTTVPPEAGGADLLGTYRRAVQATPGGGTVVLVSSGVQTVDPLDVRALGWDLDADAVAGDLKSRGLVPDARGRRVEFLGLGIAFGTQPALPLPAAKRITELWRAVCAASGADACVVRDDDLPRALSASERPVPVVPVDATATACQGSSVLPASVAFAADRAVLLDGADLYLRPIADGLRRCPGARTVRIGGHTARVGPGVSGVELSALRAGAVRERLVALGVAPGLFGPVEGFGSARPTVDNMPGGVFSEPLARQNRRVEITVTTKEGTSPS